MLEENKALIGCLCTVHSDSKPRKAIIKKVIESAFTRKPIFFTVQYQDDFSTGLLSHDKVELHDNE